MNIDKAVLCFAGFVVLLGLALGWLVSPYWSLLTAFAGLNMIQASFTGSVRRRSYSRKSACGAAAHFLSTQLRRAQPAA